MRINVMDQLPCHMKISFIALYNYVHEMAYDALKEKGINVAPRRTCALISLNF
jgi:hypothetical protein